MTPGRTGRRPGRAVLAPGALALALLTSACAGGDPALKATAPPDTGTYPVVAGKQATVILDRIDQAVTTGAEPDRLAGPYLQLRTALENQAKLLKTPPPEPAVPGRARVLVPSSSTWPRFFLSVGTAPKAPTPTLRLLVSVDPRKPYALFSETFLLPGVTLPDVAGDGAAQALDPSSATGLRRSPDDAVFRYADVLVRGAASPEAKNYGDGKDAFSTQVSGQVAKDRTALVKVATVTARQKVEPGTTFAVRTADGGALVFSQLTETVLIQVKPDAGTIQVSDPKVAALAGRKVFAKQVVRTSTELLTLYVPPASGTGTITVVGAQKADLSITGT